MIGFDPPSATARNDVPGASGGIPQASGDSILKRSMRLAAWSAELLQRQPQYFLLCEAVMLAMIIGYLDYAVDIIAGAEVNLVVFYSIPILLMVRFGDRLGTCAVAVFCGIAWWWADTRGGRLSLVDWLQIYNTATNLIFFLLVAIVGLTMKSKMALMERSRRLEKEVIRISEHEQQRIGQDLHDGLCQYFAAISCAAASLRDDLTKRDIPEARDAREIADLLKQGVTQTRNISRGLFPVQIDELGLESALAELAKSAGNFLNVECALECAEPVSIHDNIVATQLYRIAQEALNNATHHGRASSVRIQLEERGNTVTLRIIDNGSGLPPGAGKSGGMGMKIMDYRANLIGGRFNIASHPAGGTVVTCAFAQAEKE